MTYDVSSISQPVEGTALRTLSLGAGIQSSTLLLMAERGDIGPKPDAAKFADTGFEPSATYAWLDQLETQTPSCLGAGLYPAWRYGAAPMHAGI